MSGRVMTLDDGRRVRITSHAATRLVEMRLGSPHIRDILTNPDQVYESRKYPGCVTYRRGDHALGTRLDHGDLVIMTALYARKGAWVAAANRGLLPGDRHLPDADSRL